MASRNIAWRTSAAGQPAPTTCSFRRSPAPRPSRNRPSLITLIVAAAWATMAGWYLMVGQVTIVTSSSRSVSAAMAPSTLQANGACSWLASHGWKWSDIPAKSNPASSASRAWRRSSAGP